MSSSRSPALQPASQAIVLLEFLSAIGRVAVLISEDMPLDPFIEDITVTAAPVSAPTDAPGPPDRDAILAERGGNSRGDGDFCGQRSHCGLDSCPKCYQTETRREQSLGHVE